MPQLLYNLLRKRNLLCTVPRLSDLGMPGPRQKRRSGSKKPENGIQEPVFGPARGNDAADLFTKHETTRLQENFNCLLEIGRRSIPRRLEWYQYGNIDELTAHPRPGRKPKERIRDAESSLEGGRDTDGFTRRIQEIAPKLMLTLIFSTYNRGHLLAKTLNSFCQLSPPKHGWKVIAVDNRSSDDTKQILMSFRDRLPLTYIYESKPGKSAALNRGLAEREGELIVLTDDDVIAHRDWLSTLESAAEARPNYDLFGGRIIPHWETVPEDWLADAVSLQGNYALTGPSWADGPIKASHIFGPNMALRRAVFDKGLRFDEYISVDGTSTFPMGDETDFLVRAEKAGFKAWFVNDAVVAHMIPASSLEPRWLIRRAFRQGRGKVCVFSKAGAGGVSQLFGSPRYLWRVLLKNGLEVCVAYLSFNRRNILKARWQFNYRWGQIYQYRVFSRANKK